MKENHIQCLRCGKWSSSPVSFFGKDDLSAYEKCCCIWCVDKMRKTAIWERIKKKILKRKK